MTSSEQRERERIQRLREQQLSSRYAGTSSKLRFYGKLKDKKAPPKPNSIYWFAFGSMDGRYKGLILGGILGFAAMVVILFMLPRGSEYSILSIVPMIICLGIGFTLGKATE